MVTGNLRKLLILVILIVIASTFGCGAGGRDVMEVSSLAVDSFTDLILPDARPVLKKKILIAPVINNAGITDAQAEEIEQDCISYLSRDDYLLITTSKKWGDKDSSPSQMTSYGAVINPEYSNTAEEMGMNIFLGCIIRPLEITEKRTGVWPFRKDSYNVLIAISISAYDTINGTLIVYEDNTSDVNIKKTDSGENDKWTPDYNMLKKEISSMTKKLCSSVIDKLRKQPWQSKVTVEDGNLVINAGTAIGINENTVFDIFKEGDLIEAYRAGGYYILGEKLGESGAKSISEHRTVLAANTDLKDAAYVRVKRK